jgi:peptidyl-prolyl cis-trans isomerase C
VAKVGEVEVPRDAFMAIYDLKLLKYKDRDRAVPRSADRRYRRSIVDRLIWHETLRQEAAALGVDYDPAALEERKAAQRKGIKDWEQHLRRRGESEASLEALFVAELRERAILDKLGKLTITDADVDAEYEKRRESTKADKERIRAAHILVQIGPEDRPAAGAAAPTDDEPTRSTRRCPRQTPISTRSPASCRTAQARARAAISARSRPIAWWRSSRRSPSR